MLDNMNLPKIGFFKWKSTGVLSLGIVLMISSMYFESIGSKLAIVVFLVSLLIVIIGVTMILLPLLEKYR